MAEPVIEIRNRPEERRYEIVVDGVVAGYSQYRSSPGVRSFDHTLIEDDYQGRGLAGLLVARALEDTRSEGLTVEPYCPYVKSYIETHPAFLDLVPPEVREEFDLPSGASAAPE